jgi:hypothetical protein
MEKFFDVAHRVGQHCFVLVLAVTNEQRHALGPLRRKRGRQTYPNLN